MIGTEFTDSNGNPGTDIASEVQKGCIDKGLLPHAEPISILLDGYHH